MLRTRRIGALSSKTLASNERDILKMRYGFLRQDKKKNEEEKKNILFLNQTQSLEPFSDIQFYSFVFSFSFFSLIVRKKEIRVLLLLR